MGLLAVLQTVCFVKAWAPLPSLPSPPSLPGEPSFNLRGAAWESVPLGSLVLPTHLLSLVWCLPHVPVLLRFPDIALVSPYGEVAQLLGQGWPLMVEASRLPRTGAQ